MTGQCADPFSAHLNASRAVCGRNTSVDVIPGVYHLERQPEARQRKNGKNSDRSSGSHDEGIKGFSVIWSKDVTILEVSA